MSAGGYETSQVTAELLGPVLSRSTAPKILEVGCGIGGACFFFANEYNADVYGVDINEVGIEMAKRELETDPVKKGSCKFDVLDVSKADFEECTFDIIYSRDVLLHLSVPDKKELFEKFKLWLKPSGMVCVCDYSLGPKSAVKVSDAFQEYMRTRAYHLVSPQNYKQIFVDVGFEEDFVVAEDRQLWYCQISQKELDRVLTPGPARDAFLETQSQKDLDKLIKVYQDKITMTLRGDRSYVILTATKQPSHYKERCEVVDAYRTLSEKNFIMSCDGNVSCRVKGSQGDELFLVTPSGVMIPDLTPDKVVLCHNNSGKAAPGESYKPSSESGLHDCIYRARPDVGAIVHLHSIYVCALACCRLPLPPAHYAACELMQEFDFSDPAGGSTYRNVNLEDAVVKCAPYHTYGTRPLSQATLNGLGQNHAVLMANHGAVVVGENMEMALYNAERLERECEIYWRCLQMQSVGPPKPLTLTEIRDLQKADETYGQEHPDKAVDDDVSDATPDMEAISVSPSSATDGSDVSESSD
ncbi:MAG: hypothetical protein SGILL_006620 [Bacillariaceae sp.]